MFSIQSFVIVVICASASLLCELLNALILFKSSGFKALLSEMDHFNEQERHRKDKPKLLQRQKAQQKIAAGLFFYRMCQTLITLIVMGVTMQMVTRYYYGVPVAKLPFTPFKLFAKLTHRGLESEDLTECSSHLIYILSTMAFRTTWPKYFNVAEQAILAPSPMKFD